MEAWALRAGTRSRGAAPICFLFFKHLLPLYCIIVLNWEQSWWQVSPPVSLGNFSGLGGSGWDHLPQREEEELQAGRDGRCCSREIIVVLKPGERVTAPFTIQTPLKNQGLFPKLLPGVMLGQEVAAARRPHKKCFVPGNWLLRGTARSGVPLPGRASASTSIKTNINFP